MTTVVFEPIYDSFLLALLVAAATVATILLVTPPTENRSHRRWLITLRLIAAGVLLLAVLRPGLARTDSQPTEAALIVAVDVSRSMTLPDGDGETRWAAQQKAWRKLASAVPEFDGGLSLRLLAYDSQARKIPSTVPAALDEVSPDGELTDLSAAALSSIQAAEGQPIAGVILMGDGTQTSPLVGTGAQRVVETLDSLGVPLWTVPIGPAGGTSASRDVAIDALSENYQLFSGNEVPIDFQVLARGLAGVELPVRLSWIAADGTTTEIASRRVTAAKSADVAAISVPIVAPAPGTYQLKVEAVPQTGELVTSNNSQIAFVDVREGGGRILYLEGVPRVEQTFLRRSLRRFPDLDLTFRWIPSDTSASWPIDRSEWFRPGKFDVYMIGDLGAEALGTEQLRGLADAVAAGAGLVTLGGNEAYSRAYAGSPLDDVLPVQLPAKANPISDSVEVELARNHPITDLGGDDPSQVWKSLPPLLGANRLSDPKVAPGVMVLLQTPADEPLLVVGQYGRGRTAALAFDSTWRWWRAGNSDAHRRFWRQLVLWLLAREESSGDEIQIELNDRRFPSSDPPSFRASVQSIEGSQSQNELVAEIIDASAEVIPVTVGTESRRASASPPQSVAIVGQIPKLEPGIYKLRVRAMQPSESLRAAEMAFQVTNESRELAQPMADPIYMRQLAQLTSEHGGAAFAPDEIDALIEMIRQRRSNAVTPVVEKVRLGDGPLSGWLLFLLFAGAISTEWFLRRQWGLA